MPSGLPPGGSATDRAAASSGWAELAFQRERLITVDFNAVAVSADQKGFRDMSRRYLAVTLATLLIISALSFAAPSTRAEIDIAVGDYWEYTFGGDFEGVSVSGDLTYKVKSTTQDNYILQIYGSGEVSGFSDNVSVAGDVDFEGSMKRLRSNFSQLESAFIMELSTGSFGFTVTTTYGLVETDDPSLDDYIGDDNPSEGVTVVSRCEVQLDTWIEVMLFNESESMTENVTVTMTVLEENVTVEVPAGTFECYKVSLEIDSGSDVSTEYMYYSSEVGFYVKLEGPDMMMLAGLSSLELTDYSYGDSGGGILSMLADNWWILLVIVVVAAVIVAAVLLRPRPPSPYPLPPPIQPMPPPSQ